MAYSPLALANTFVAHHGGVHGISHMKLQKLAFYAYGWWLAYHEEPILTEAPEVWKFGPVFESLYSALRPFGSAPITRPVTPPFGEAPLIPAEDTNTLEWVDWVWNRYGHLSALQLSDMTHEVGTPWQIEAEAKEYRVPRHHAIPDATTKRYFEGLAKDLS
jgi:uncharacterized phage-associated protein